MIFNDIDRLRTIYALDFGIVEDTGNIFHLIKNQVRTQEHYAPR